ncbi:MAG TPA: hypothetical protein VF039_13315 [Longimicrobiales bacterium]
MRHFIPPLVVLCSALLAPGAAQGQSVLDWPVLLEARPSALVVGAGAVLVNPANAGDLAGRAEALVSDLETPDAMGLRALTIAAALNVTGGWTLGVGYRHMAVGDMLLTDGPPVAGGTAELPTLDVAEDVYAVAVSFRTGALGFGMAARLDTPADALGNEEAWAGTVGASWTPRVPVVGLRLAGLMELDDDAPDIGGAVELEAPPVLDQRLRLGLGYGTRSATDLGREHLVVGTGTWRGVAELQAGASAQPGTDGTDWVPMLAGLVRIGRYRLGIVREHLPNGFGAAMHYRLSVAF